MGSKSHREQEQALCLGTLVADETCFVFFWFSESLAKLQRLSGRGAMEIVYVYQKHRKDFGRAPKFSDVDSDTLDETVPNPDQVAAA